MTPTAIGTPTAAQQNVDAASAASPTPEQKKAAREFEAIFLRQLLSSLEKSSGLSGGESSGGQVFRSMMVSALADTASEGGGIGLSELILKAMLPPPPQAEPNLSPHAPSPPGGARAPGSEGPVLTRAGPGSIEHGELGEPSSSARWGASSRVLTEARGGRMLESAAGFSAPALQPRALERRTPEEGSGR